MGSTIREKRTSAPTAPLLWQQLLPSSCASPHSYILNGFKDSQPQQ